MKKKDLHELEYHKSCKYAMEECEKYGFEPIDYAENFADCYADGYKACWEEMSKPKLNLEDENKMSKEIADEYAGIAYNALAQLVVNGNINPISHKESFKAVMNLLSEFKQCPV